MLRAPLDRLAVIIAAILAACSGSQKPFPRLADSPRDLVVTRRVLIRGFPGSLQRPFPVRTAGPGRSILDLGNNMVSAGGRYALGSALSDEVAGRPGFPVPASSMISTPHKRGWLSLETDGEGWRLGGSREQHE